MSTNLGAPQVAPGQNNKEITINDAVGRIDAALTANLSIEAEATQTLTSTQFRSAFFIDLVAGGAAAPFVVTVPALQRGLFVVRNSAGFTATVEIDSQPITSPTINDGSVSLLYCDGINVVQLL